MYGKPPKISGYLNGQYISKKTKNKICYRSSYELKALEILETDTNVLDYKYEPFSIPYDNNHTTIPDFLVSYKNGIYKLIEVKPKNLINLWNNQIKIDAMKKYCIKNNLIFEIWDEDILFNNN